MTRRSAILRLGGSSLAPLTACRHDEPDIPEILPEISRLSDFTLTAQNGQPFRRASLAPRIWILCFFYSSCRLACPRMMAALAKIQKQVASDSRVALLSISVDPLHDTPQVLAAYAASHHAQEGKWYFLTGDATAAQRLQREANPEMDPEDPTHSQHFFLVDAEGYIRGFYKSTRPAELEILTTDTRKLLANPVRP